VSTQTIAVSLNCQTGGLERTRFFAGQLVAPDDLTLDQNYFREKARRHNRLLHGWGVVCGARVRGQPGETEVQIESGYILGPYGDEISIKGPVTFDLCETSSGDSSCPDDDADFWCSDTRKQGKAGTYYLAVRYTECKTRPVRAMSGGCSCGCAEGQCEYSRIRDSYELKLLDELPATYSTPMRPPSPMVALSCRTGQGACPDCPESPWVILADLQLNGDCSIDSLDCFAHRRYVASFADFYFMCDTQDDDKNTNLSSTLDLLR
jgi:hypothetical protein